MYPYDVIEEQNYLMHHCIKGQRWGVRRYQNEDGTLTEAGRKKYGSDDNIAYNKLKAKRTKDLSNDELRQLIERRDLELQYENLNSKYKDQGQNYVKKAMVDSGAKFLANAATIAAVAVGARYLAKKYNINAETVTKGILKTAGTIAETTAKTTGKAAATAGKEIVKSVSATGKDIAKNVSETNREVRKKASSSDFARKYVKTVNKIIGK